MRLFLPALLVSVGLATGAQAQTLAGFTGSIGGGPGYGPDYEGSDTYSFEPVVVGRITYRNVAFADFGRRYAGAHLLRGRNFRAGPMIRYRDGRSEDQAENDELEGMGDINWTLELGAYAELALGPLILGAEMSQDILEEHEGFVADVRADYYFNPTPRSRASLGVFGSWASESYMQSFFGVTAAQAASTAASADNPTGGLGAYTPEAGLKDLGLNATFTYDVAQNVSLTALAQYKLLLDEAEESPLVAGGISATNLNNAGDSNQYFVGAAISYRF